MRMDDCASNGRVCPVSDGQSIESTAGCTIVNAYAYANYTEKDPFYHSDRIDFSAVSDG